MNKSLLIAAAVAAVLILTLPGVLSVSEATDSEATVTDTNGDGLEQVDQSITYKLYNEKTGQYESVTRDSYNLLFGTEQQPSDPLSYKSPYTVQSWSGSVNDGVYVVRGDIHMESLQYLYIRGNVTLVFDGPGSSLTYERRIVVVDGSSLTICNTDPDNPGEMYTRNITGGENGTSSINIHGVEMTVVTDEASGPGNEPSYYSAGIGSLYGNSKTTTVNIYSGTIDVTTKAGAGIGGGAGTGETIVNIYSGTINAHSETGAGIGAGQDSGNTTVNIYGGNITASSSDGAGIGSGKNNSRASNSYINVYGGQISAESVFGPGIGSSSGSNTMFTIDGIAMITAHSVEGPSIGVSGENASVDVTMHTGELVCEGTLGELTSSSSLKSTVEVTNGYLYAKTANIDELTVSGGGAFFYNDLIVSDDKTSYEENGGNMDRYVLSEEFEHLQLYLDAMEDGYAYAIDHVHNELGKEHTSQDGPHRHCSVLRYDDNPCDYSPVTHHTFGDYQDDPDAKRHYRECLFCHSREYFDHEYTTASEVDDDEHEFECSICGGKGTAPHDLDHDATPDGRHLKFCTECEYEKVSDHAMTFLPHDEYVHSWYCNDCKEEGESDHSFRYVDNGDGTHTGVCICGEVSSAMPHEYVDGFCECGAIHPGLMGGGMDDILPPTWGYDDATQDLREEEEKEWIAIAVAATAATIMAVFLIWDRRR